MGAGEWIALAGFVGTLLVSIFGAGMAFGRIRSVAAEVAASIRVVSDKLSAMETDVKSLQNWKEDARVDLGTNFVRKADLRDAIDNAIAPVRRTAEQTHDIVTRIAARMHIPAVEDDA